MKTQWTLFGSFPSSSFRYRVRRMWPEPARHVNLFDNGRGLILWVWALGKQCGVCLDMLELLDARQIMAANGRFRGRIRKWTVVFFSISLSLSLCCGAAKEPLVNKLIRNDLWLGCGCCSIPADPTVVLLMKIIGTYAVEMDNRLERSIHFSFGHLGGWATVGKCTPLFVINWNIGFEWEVFFGLIKHNFKVPVPSVQMKCRVIS